MASNRSLLDHFSTIVFILLSQTAKKSYVNTNKYIHRLHHEFSKMLVFASHTIKNLDWIAQWITAGGNWYTLQFEERQNSRLQYQCRKKDSTGKLHANDRNFEA